MRVYMHTYRWVMSHIKLFMYTITNCSTKIRMRHVTRKVPSSHTHTHTRTHDKPQHKHMNVSRHTQSSFSAHTPTQNESVLCDEEDVNVNDEFTTRVNDENDVWMWITRMTSVHDESFTFTRRNEWRTRHAHSSFSWFTFTRHSRHSHESWTRHSHSRPPRHKERIHFGRMTNRSTNIWMCHVTHKNSPLHTHRHTDAWQIAAQTHQCVMSHTNIFLHTHTHTHTHMTNRSTNT